MFDIGFGEMLLLGVIALIAIGPKQLPEVARVVGRTLNEFKRASSDFTRSLTDARDSIDRSMNEMNQSMNEMNQSFQASVEKALSPSSGEPVQQQLDGSESHSHGHDQNDVGHHDLHEQAEPAVDEADQMSFDLAKDENNPTQPKGS